MVTRQTHPTSIIALLSLGLLALAWAVGCGDGGGSGGGGASGSTFERIQTQVFDVSCSAATCHSHVGQAGGMVLDADSSWDALVNQPPSNRVATEQGLLRVSPGHPEASFLMAKLADNLAAGEGVSMPYGAAPLDAATVEVIRAWIAAGAPAEGMVPGDDGRPLGGGGDTPGGIDLPPPSQGVQLAVTADPVPRGQEETSCHYLKLPSDVDFDVDRFQIAVTGGSHHVHLYRPYDSTLDIPDGSEVCNKAVDFNTWELVVATQLRHADWELPTGVAYHFRAHEQLLMQTHFVNVGSLETVGRGKVLMNLNAAEAGSVTAHAGAMFGQNKDVFVAAHTNPTADAECVFPKAIQLMAETGHYHFRGREFQTFLWDNGVRGDRIYDYQGYDDPPFTVHSPPIAFAPGQGVQWECYWENTTDTDFPFGPFTATNEHCNWFAFYYPTESLNEAITCVKDHGVSTTTVRHGD
jgi:copper type II ascorbate-dependent monooxygenase-like protein